MGRSPQAFSSVRGMRRIPMFVWLAVPRDPVSLESSYLTRLLSSSPSPVVYDAPTEELPACSTRQRECEDPPFLNINNISRRHEQRVFTLSCEREFSFSSIVAFEAAFNIASEGNGPLTSSSFICVRSVSHSDVCLACSASRSRFS